MVRWVLLVWHGGGDQVVPTARSHLQRWAEVVNHSDRSVTLIDLCGHEKYLKTTVFGLTGKITFTSDVRIHLMSISA